MIIYENTPVEVSYQNFGSSYLIILTGEECDIESTFNGLYNFGATNGQLRYRDACHSVATFWSSEYKFWHCLKMMRINHFCLTRAGKGKGQKRGWLDEAEKWAMDKLNELKEEHVLFIDYVKESSPGTSFYNWVLESDNE